MFNRPLFTHHLVLAALARHVTFVSAFVNPDVLVWTGLTLCPGLLPLVLSLVASVAQVVHPLHQIAERLLLL